MRGDPTSNNWCLRRGEGGDREGRDGGRRVVDTQANSQRPAGRHQELGQLHGVAFRSFRGSRVLLTPSFRTPGLHTRSTLLFW